MVITLLRLLCAAEPPLNVGLHDAVADMGEEQRRQDANPAALDDLTSGDNGARSVLAAFLDAAPVLARPKTPVPDHLPGP